MSLPSAQILLILLVSKLSYAILIGEQPNNKPASEPEPNNNNATNSRSQDAPPNLSGISRDDRWPNGHHHAQPSNNEPETANSNNNTTFFYEANEFLINSNSEHNNSTTKRTNTNKEDEELNGRALVNGPGQQQAVANKPSFAPASQAMTSSRSGRMLDLDALMGDMAASRANKERSQTGNRQSRYLASPSTFDGIGGAGGKRLQIQGFIPIVGVKDVIAGEDGTGVDLEGASSISDSTELEQAMRRLRAQQQQTQSSSSSSSSSSKNNNNNNELPYAQSSMGHASFGVQRYLNSEQPAVQAVGQQQHLEAKFSGASSVVDSLKRPIKRLAGFASGGTEHNNQPAYNSLKQQQQQQNCLCVPFYMCKNGYISESSLGKSQIQQMIMQQQQQQQQASFSQLKQQMDQQQMIEMKSGQLIAGQQQQQRPSMPAESTQPQPQYSQADTYVPLDERSLDREIITMASLTDSNPETVQQQQQQFQNQTNDQFNSGGLTSGQSAATDQQQQSLQPTVYNGDEQAMPMLNSTEIGSQTSDYSQDILGRMLGLKSTSKVGAASTPGSAVGVCGLLRSCCDIPSHLFPSQQDLANERLMAQYGSSIVNQNNNKYQQQQPILNRIYSPSAGQSDLLAQQQQQQVMALQKYQQQQVAMSNLNGQQQRQQLPYGFPSQISRMQPMQPMNLPLNSLPIEQQTSMAHRSNQFQVATTRYPPQMNQVAQYTRATAPAQLQSFQQQQAQQSLQPHLIQQAKALPVSPVSSQYQQASSINSLMRNPSLAGLGTRKILDGRCGLRQSAGITGRVQNLQYHESSADFGEYPAQAAILKRLSGSDSLFVCGGTLISQYWVATAAHCIKKHAQAELKIRLGEWDVHRDDEFYPFVEKEVRDLVIHPEFVAGNLVNDIALLRLDSPIDPSLPHVNPACLPNIDESFVRQRCWVTGWGKDSFGQKGSFQAVLKEVELPVVGQGECESALRQTRLGQHYRLHSGFICAGGEGGKDACEGDGGSGLYCVQDGIIKVAGLVSWGIGCGQAGVPGVYISLAYYRPWIENIISIDEDIYSPYTNMIGNSLISERNNNSNSTEPITEPASFSSSSSSTTKPPTV